MRKDWINFCCPYHFGSKKNFGVNIVSGAFKCLGCGHSGTIDELMEKLGGSSTESEEEIPLVAMLSEEPIVSQRFLPVSDNTVNVVKSFRPLSEGNNSVLWSQGSTYAQSRGVRLNDSRFGFFPKFPGRLFLLFWEGRECVFFQGRDFIGSGPKTLNPDSSKGWRLKTRVLFNIDKMESKNIVITEGPFDALSCERVPNFVSTCILGNTISDWQVSALRKKKVKSVTVFLDRGEDELTQKMCLQLYIANLPVRFIKWRRDSPEKDPGDLSLKKVTKMIWSSELFSPPAETLSGRLLPF